MMNEHVYVYYRWRAWVCSLNRWPFAELVFATAAACERDPAWRPEGLAG